QWARNALKYNPENYRACYQLGFIETKTESKLPLPITRKLLRFRVISLPCAATWGCCIISSKTMPKRQNTWPKRWNWGCTTLVSITSSEFATTVLDVSPTQ